MADFYTMEEAARVLGISLDELKQRIESGDLRQAGEGGSPQFRKGDVDEYARRQGLGSDPDLQSDLSFDDLDFNDIFLGQGETDLGAPTVGIKKEDVEAALKPDLSSAERDLLGQATGSKPGESDIQLVRVSPQGASDSDVRISPVAPKKGPSDSDVTLLSSESLEIDIADMESLTGTSRPGDTAVNTVEMGSSGEIPQIDGSSDFELSPSGVIEALQPESGSDFELSALDSSSELDFPGTQTASATDVRSGPAGSGVNLSRPNDSGIGLASFDADSIELAPIEEEKPKAAPVQPAAQKPAPAPAPKPGKPSDTGVAAASANFDDSGFDLDDGSIDMASAVVSGGDKTLQIESASDFEIEQSDELSLMSEAALAPVGSGRRPAPKGLVTPESGSEWDIGPGMGAEPGSGDAPAESAPKSASKPAPAIIRTQSTEWGTGWVVGLSISTALMLVLCMVAFDLVKNLYEFRGPTPVASGMIKQIAGLLGGK